MYSVISSQ